MCIGILFNKDSSIFSFGRGYSLSWSSSRYLSISSEWWESCSYFGSVSVCKSTIWSELGYL